MVLSGMSESDYVIVSAESADSLSADCIHTMEGSEDVSVL